MVLDLGDNSYRPFKKENSETVYVHKLSNHPEYIKAQIPISINKRLCKLSKSNKQFDYIKTNYQEALTQSKYNFKLDYSVNKQTDGATKRKRKRKIIYFHPPFSANVKTPIGRKFLNLIKRHFTPNHPLYKFLNPKCLKISYCCMPNVKEEITSINRKVMGRKEIQPETSPMCNCRGRIKNPNVCPLDGKCKKEQLVYRADVESNGKSMIYVGSTGRSFKDRYTKHKASLKHRNSDVPTTLSTYYWKEKDQGNEPTIKWSIVKEVRGRYTLRNGCPLCNREKLEIAKINKNMLINKRNELRSSCPHHRSDFFPTIK